ncbi:MAG: thioesterase family protein, partial [Chloroflexota bacterium]
VRLGKSSLDMEHWVTRRKNDDLQIVAQATATIVIYDYDAQKSTPIPDDWRALVKAYEVVAPSE